MSEPVIRIKNLKKNYGTFQAVNDISFDVQEGEIFGLLGPNGAGKTTTLEIIETLRPKSSGQVTVLGYNLDKDPAKIKAQIGIQLQQADFYPGLNLVEIIGMFAGLYGTKANAMDLLAKVNLTDKAKSKYDKMSGGQKQRFSIATTLINRPKIIFLDEPTTGLDPQARRNLWDLIKEIRAGGTTVVLTTHYMDEAEVLCDRLAIMDRGQILKMSEPDQLIDELLATGFTKTKTTKQATLEDVFLNLTGREWRED